MPTLEQPIPIIRERDKVRVKLPKLKIEKFSGDPKQYRTFRDAFDLVANENNDLTDVEKLTYLRSYLTGDALRLQAGLAVTRSNYRVALELLERRFGTKEVIIKSHMESLYKLSVIRSSEDLKSIRYFPDKFEINLRSLEAIGIEPESYGCLLVPMIKDKIPNELNIHTSCKFDASVDIWKINDLMRELKLEIEARERVGDAKRLKSQRTPRDTVEGLLSVDKITCPFCQQDHFAGRCNIVTNVNTRKRMLQCQSRCHICTKRGYHSRNCKSKETCFRCKGRHHTSICERNKNSSRQHTNNDKSNDSKKSDDNKDSIGNNEQAQQPNTSRTVTNTVASNNKVVLMQTATVVVNSKQNNYNRVKRRLLFDGGSQRTYVLKTLVDAIEAKTIRTEYLAVRTFGASATVFAK